MTLRFYNFFGTFVVILFVLVVVQKIDAVPSKLSDYYSYDDETKPSTADASNRPDFTSTGSEKRPEERPEISGEMKGFHYSESSASYGDGESETAVVEISEKKEATRKNDKKPEIQERRSWGKDSSEDEDDDDDDFDDNNNNYTDNAEKELIDLIDNAIKSHWLLSPKELSPPSSNTFKPVINQPVYDPHWIFPDQLPTKRPAPAKVVPRCENSTFCLDPDFYLSDADIERSLNLRYLEPISDPVIAERMGPDDEENGLCVSYKHTIPPKTAIADDNKWYYILNNEKYEQLVHVEMCSAPDTQCSLIDGFASGYTTTCKQKYIHRQLVAVEKVGEPAERRLFPMPSSCCCHVKFTGTPAQRIGAGSLKKN